MQARPLDRSEVEKKLIELAKKVLEQIEKGEYPYLEIPVRGRENTVWDPEKKMFLLGDRVKRRELFDLGEARKFMQTLLMLKIIVQAIREGVYPTIRDLYYHGKHTITYIEYLDVATKCFPKVYDKVLSEDPDKADALKHCFDDVIKRGRGLDHVYACISKLAPEYLSEFKRCVERSARRSENTWDEQYESNEVIEDIEAASGALREHMGISADVKGKMVGPIVVKSGNDIIDCTKLGEGAFSLPPNPDSLEIIKLDASYVLVIEKDAIFQRLHREGFWKRENCILVTAKGMPDRATRRMVRRLAEEFNLPVYVLTDGDPFGWYIYSVYKIGSMSLSFESTRLATPQAKFLGLLPSDVIEYKISDNYVIKIDPPAVKEKKSGYRKIDWCRLLDELGREKFKKLLEIIGNSIPAPTIEELEEKCPLLRRRKKEKAPSFARWRYHPDIARAVDLLAYQLMWFNSKRWMDELKLFLQLKRKVEIEALSTHGFKFLHTYIKDKLDRKLFID